MNSLQEQNITKLERAMGAKKVNREYVAKLTATAHNDIAAMREYASKRAGKVQDFCNSTADKWQAQVDAAMNGKAAQ